MTTQHIETLIIGAGQAGLSTGSALRRRQRPFLIVDRNDRIGDNWRCHYDSLRLYSPAKYDGLPGLPFPSADPWSYPGKDEVADYLERYAVHWDLPVRLRTGVDRLTARPGGGFVARLGTDTITCDNVVIATGTFGRTPAIPDFATELDPAITQLHSSRYRRPDQLAPGPVLVVGASHSGTDIAYELARTHRTILCGRDCGQIPVRWDTSAIKLALPVLVFMWRHVLTRRTPIGRKMMREIRFHGGPMLRVKRSDLDERGVRRITARMRGVRNGRPELDDGTVLDVRNIVWATGFRQVFDWIDLPIFDADGWPKEYRGVVADAPGLFFCGLSFQYAFSSMVFPGVGRDAEYVARRIAARAEELAVPAAAA
ncbi:NAD(P)-binding domain-containing protein [Nocardia cyriacigeorgica]|uniref:NAD(P)-binding domain-containing protein n=1 Tax=Nocardia cyriacigeorgica TaxID=135487 RepID=A0A6P1CII4_9NOCA|nr:NAD(P)/FAD-dependent oxidoreductase [Nocardia cyriacigeorgica]MBF6288058.1 NAD(P)-binding domain-containing protein [Nocardia cyriacigeorgica]MBF6498739.1 NAD(P)-binding domain-containing protein [Nocardia cyriacigeorgica]NEW32439.1 NAD(P)-binding domain-containing protein [Nocardia cyriacigeorgica]BDU05549.1 oxidoreductase [Nocardia cyriacigeorgica]